MSRLINRKSSAKPSFSVARNGTVAACAKQNSTFYLPTSDRDEIVERERERERERGDSCMCELVYLHLRVTTNNEDLS